MKRRSFVAGAGVCVDAGCGDVGGIHHGLVGAEAEAAFGLWRAGGDAVNSYDQAASAKWHNVWLFVIVVSLMFIDWSLRGIAIAIRDATPPRCAEQEVTP